MTCDDYETWLEQRLHGALAPEESAALDAHLAACPSCRTYAGLARGTERTMQAAGAEMEARIDWERVRGAVLRGSRRYWLEHWVGLGWMALVAAVLVWKRLPWEAVVVTLAASLPLFALATLHVRRRFAAAREAQKDDAASLAWMRAEIEVRLRERRHALFLHVVLCACMAVPFILGILPPSGLPVTARVWGLAMLALVLGDAAYGVWIDLPRLLRERDELRE